MMGEAGVEHRLHESLPSSLMLKSQNYLEDRNAEEY